MSELSEIYERLNALEKSDVSLSEKLKFFEQRLMAIETAVKTLPEICIKIGYIADTLGSVAQKQDEKLAELEKVKQTKADRVEVKKVEQEVLEMKLQPADSFSRIKWIVITAAMSATATAIISAVISTLK